MFLKPSEYLRELYSINVCLILYDIFLIFLPCSNNAVFTFILLSFSVRYKLFVSVLQWLACLFSLPVFFSALQSCWSVVYVPAWLLEFVKVLKRQSLILSFLVLETEMKDNRMKRSSHNALLRLQHHRITIHITVAVAGLRKTGFEHFLFWYGVLHLVFRINNHGKFIP